MNKRLLLISNSTNYGEEYLDYTRPLIQKFLGKQIREVLFVPYAAVDFSYVEYTNQVSQVFMELGYGVRSIDDVPDKANAIEKAEAIVIGGGNTFHLVHMMHETGIMEPIRKHVEAGTPFIGWSAGANVACPTMKTTNDMPVIQPRSFDTLGLVSFQINPHYTDGVIPNHNGETREARLREFLALNPDVVVVGLKEGTMLQIENGQVKLQGTKTVKVFKHEQPTLEFDKNASLDFLLS
jgi:dipeptidase E